MDLPSSDDGSGVQIPTVSAGVAQDNEVFTQTRVSESQRSHEPERTARVSGQDDGDLLLPGGVAIVPAVPHPGVPPIRAMPLSDAPEIPSDDNQWATRSNRMSRASSMSSVMTSATEPAARLRAYVSDMRRSVVWGEQRNSDTCMGRLEEHPLFQNTTLGIIVVNAVWIAVDTQWNHKSLAVDDRLPLEPYSTVIENLFCFYFFIEVIVRFVAFRRKINCLRDAWFVFDCTLVMLMVLETWIVPLAVLLTPMEGANTGMFSSMRLLRLLRLTRMARLMRFFPELMTLVKGMISATQAVGFILLFLIIVTYVFAILFTVQLGSPPDPNAPEPEEGADPTAKELFSDLGSSMMTLFTNGVLGDNLYSTLVTIKVESIPLMWAFILFFFISSMTLLNMLIGVLCAVIEETAKQEFEVRQVYDLRTTLKRAFAALDRSQDGTISADEWHEIRDNPEVRTMFEGLGIDSSQLDARLDQLQETIFGRMKSTSPGLCFEEFMERVIDLKWGTAASALDLESLKAQVLREDKNLRKKLGGIERVLVQLTGQPLRPSAVSSRQSSQSLLGSGGDRLPTPKGVGPFFAGVGGPLRLEDAEPQVAETGSWAARAPSPAAQSQGSYGEDAARVCAAPGGCDWLQEVPTELLFHVLKLRSPPTE